MEGALMKKKSLLAVAGTMSLLLAACSTTATPTTNTNETSKLTLEEVYMKSLEANEDITSLKALMEMEQSMTLPEEDVTFDTTSKMEMEVVIDPFAMYQVNETTMSGIGADGMEQTMNMESYFSKEGFFVFDSMSNQWLKLPQEMSDQLLQLNEMQSDPADQMKQLESFMEDFTFEQNDSSYTLTLEASGEKFNAFLKEQSQAMLPEELGMGVDPNELFESISFEDVTYTMVIGKDDFLLDSLDVQMTMNLDMEGQMMSIAQTIETEYVEYNTTESITIPQEVLDTAVEQEF